MITILSTIFVLGVLVFIHEMGHFLGAKLFKIRVDRFSMGFPPRLIGKKIGETDYCISLIPFGGYVKIAGMVDESLDKEQLSKEPKVWEFRSKSWFQKAIVIVAAPLMNILLAVIIFIGGALFQGVGMISEVPIVGSVMEGKPALQAGIQKEDLIVAVNKVKIKKWSDLVEIIHGSPGETLQIDWMRNDTLFSEQIVPVKDKINNKQVGLIGITPKIEVKRIGFFKAVASGFETCYNISKMILEVLGKLITGKESIRTLGGPVAIARMAGESARTGFDTLIYFMALVSIHLGIFNLLPAPVLDGGHLVIIGIEAIIRKSIPLKIKLIIQQIGMILFLVLMLFVIYNDIFRVINK
jgi:regulator of sigma E protease